MHSRQTDLLALPIAIIGALILVHIEGVASILTWLVGMIFHELGHALIYWLRGIVAIPVFATTVPLHSEPSIFVTVALLALAVWGYQTSKRAGFRFLQFLIAALAILLVCFSFIIPARIGEAVMIYGGQGGELYLATLGMLLFYQTMPKRFAWHRNRYVVLALSSVCFCASSLRWYRAQTDRSQLPMGALLDFGALTNKNSESSGDIDRLIREFGWTVESIISGYTITALTCIAVLIAYYFYLCYRLMITQGENTLS